MILYTDELLLRIKVMLDRLVGSHCVWDYIRIVLDSLPLQLNMICHSGGDKARITYTRFGDMDRCGLLSTRNCIVFRHDSPLSEPVCNVFLKYETNPSQQTVLTVQSYSIRSQSALWLIDPYWSYMILNEPQLTCPCTIWWTDWCRTRVVYCGSVTWFIANWILAVQGISIALLYCKQWVVNDLPRDCQTSNHKELYRQNVYVWSQPMGPVSMVYVIVNDIIICCSTRRELERKGHV